MVRGKQPARRKTPAARREAALKREVATLKRRVDGNANNIPGNARVPKNARQQAAKKIPVPKLHKMIKDGTFVDPHLLAWARLYDDAENGPLEHAGREVDAPFNEGQPPCMRALQTRYCEQEITLDSAGKAALWLLPRGREPEQGYDPRFTKAQFGNETFVLAPQKTDGNHRAALGYFVDGTTGRAPADFDVTTFWSTSVYTNGPGGVAAADYTKPLAWAGDTSKPFTFSQNQDDGGSSYRIIAGKARLTYIGAAGSTAGVVRSVMSYEPPRAALTLDNLVGQRGYEMKPFNVTKSQSFKYHGNCEYGTEVDCFTTVTSTQPPPCRWVMYLEGNPGERFIFQFTSRYAVTHAQHQELMSPGDISPHAAHAKTAIARAAFAGGAVTKHLIEHHAQSHPILHKILSAAKTGLAALGGYEGVAALLAAM